MPRLLLAAALSSLIALDAAASDEPLPLPTATGTIHGSLMLPDATAPAPVALLIAGSGPTDRDGNAGAIPGKNDSLKMLAEQLATLGVASVRYDKRGIAESRAAGPDESALRFDTYVADAEAWIDALAADARFSRVLVIGHSEGALIGMLAAARHPGTAYVSISGTADAAATLLHRQLEGRLPADLRKANDAILEQLSAGQLVKDVPAPLAPLYRQSVQPYLISWFKYDPVTEIKNIQAPCLIVQGTTDIQVAVADAKRLHAANMACGLQLIAGMNHVLKQVGGDPQEQQASYLDPSLPLAPALTSALAEFLRGAP
jgi:alpha-beta hydrolase superfamily lysophospholipase